MWVQTCALPYREIVWKILQCKDQLISKGLFGFFNSPKERTKNFCPSRLGQQLTFQVRFLGELKTLKFPFEINWSLVILLLYYLFLWNMQLHSSNESKQLVRNKRRKEIFFQRFSLQFCQHQSSLFPTFKKMHWSTSMFRSGHFFDQSHCIVARVWAKKYT